jgi:hypothetical protein
VNFKSNRSSPRTATKQQKAFTTTTLFTSSSPDSTTHQNIQPVQPNTRVNQVVPTVNFFKVTSTNQLYQRRSTHTALHSAIMRASYQLPVTNPKQREIDNADLLTFVNQNNNSITNDCSNNRHDES